MDFQENSLDGRSADHKYLLNTTQSKPYLSDKDIGFIEDGCVLEYCAV
jgi:hypothetical protein